jgi:hypothetical protein
MGPYVSGVGTTFPPPSIRRRSGSVLVSRASVGLGASPTNLPAMVCP